MRPSNATVTKVASVPAGIVVGIGMFLMSDPWCTASADPRGGGNTCITVPTEALTQPRFAWWVCALAGVAVAVGIILSSRNVPTPLSVRTRSIVATVLRVASLPAGVGVGTGMAQFVSFCSRQGIALTHMCSWQTTYPLWALILFGVAADAVMLLLARAVAPQPPGRTPISSALSLGQ